MELPDALPAQLFEFKIDEDGARPKKVNPLTRGMALRYFIALVEGFTARFGGKLQLYNQDNSGSSDVGMDDEEIVIHVMRREVFRMGTTRARVPPLQVGSRGASWIELVDPGGQAWRVQVQDKKLFILPVKQVPGG